MKLNEIQPNKGARKPAKRLGRGDASGHGGTSTKGHKGQKARSGGYHRRGFEGGQMPLYRKMPKRGFTNIFRKEFSIINLDQLNRLPANAEVNAQSLVDAGMIKSVDAAVKILGRGAVDRAYVVNVDKVSTSAREKIIAAGGRIVEEVATA
ncbi:MAG: 50S ribosomal protein L15 [Deltaproteobacteria bacterium CG11_big_fil_rev_8_21_14_0_20_47_16]|nr:MAG: 50S ribosomal protein L15 [Deltaproteobacteria bacterium CG11_big_fil_rev_8_21_14_0_20_47_16]